MNSTSNSQQDNSTCRTYSWIAAIVAGVVVFLLAWKLLTWGFFPSLFVGVVVFLILGYALIHWFCSQATSVSSDSSTVAAAAAASSAAQSRTEPVAAPSVAPTPVPAAVVSKPTATPAPKPVAPVAAQAAKPAAAKSAAPKPAAAKPAVPKPAAPKTRLAGPRRGKADDLKMIKGVGPGIEKILNGMGCSILIRLPPGQIRNWPGLTKACPNSKAALNVTAGSARQRNWPQAKTPSFRRASKTATFTKTR